jgi:superfamily II DNA or RNA helicase
MSFALALSPDGRILADPETGDADDGQLFSKAHADLARKAIDEGSSELLLWLASLASGAGLPASALFFRAFAGCWLTGYCQRREMPASSDVDLQGMLDACPPMRGSEYLGLTVLAQLWRDFGKHVEALATAHPKGTDAWLNQRLPHWHMVGRVTLHLAENKRDVERPFSFLATYTSGLTADGKARHVLLQQAVQEYAGAAQRASLLHLLAPVSLAAERSAWLAALVETGAIYQQHTWRPDEALAFLKRVQVFEQSGLAVRIPDWWKASAPPRPKVSVTVGAATKTLLDAESLLSFQVEVTLDGEALSPADLQALQTAQGLIQIKGRWVEADAEKLGAALKHWKDAQAMHFSEGMSFQKALRLLAGAGINATETKILSEDARAWTGFAAGTWLKDVLTRLRDPSTLEESPNEASANEGLQANLRPYQKVGVRWLYFMNQLGLGACLADDMGLGKTIQVLALLLRLKREAPKGGPTLIVAPASLVTNWQAEAKKFAPGLRVLLAHPSGGEPKTTAALAKADTGGLSAENRKAALQAVLKGIDLVITTYGMVARSEALRSYPFRIAVLDEAQAIKNPSATQSRAVKALQARSRIALTGTPVENRLGDLWSLFDFINAGLLGTAPEFSRFAKRLTSQEGTQFAPLRRLVRPYILRRLKTDKSIIHDLPDKTEVNVWCGLTKQQAALYQGAVDDLSRQLNNTKAGIQKRGLILAALMHFKQICNHPSQVSGDGHYEPSASGKFVRLGELCRSIAERQEKVLVFTQFTELIPALRELLRGIFKRDGLVLTGQTPIKQRQALVQDFAREAGPPFFILSLKAGGTGLTLTQASHVIHFDRWWNPAVENQATDRAYRIGQKKNVLVHKFVCRGTLEERIDQLIADKRGLADGVLAEGNEVSLTTMSDAELLGFVALDIHQVNAEDPT